MAPISYIDRSNTLKSHMGLPKGEKKEEPLYKSFPMLQYEPVNLLL